MPPLFNERPIPGLRNGLVAWAVLAIVLVLLRGLRWDENYEFAQVMTGQVPYPAEHPLYQYTRSFFSLQPWSLAALMSLAPGPLLANGLRNVLMLWATVLPAYAVTLAVARRPVFAHAAVLLTLMGIHTQFFSNYPVQIWPDIYSNGHLGQGWALMTLALWLLGHRRAAWCCFGWMPAIHLGQFPPLALYAAWRFARAFQRGKYGELRLALRWMLPGLGASALLWCAVHWTAPTTAVWGADVEVGAVLHSYLANFASHRALPAWTGHLPLAILLALLLCLPRAAALKHYAVALAALAWGTALLHVALGPELPELLLRWMPYRILNHAAPLLIALGVGLLARAPCAGAPVLLLLLLAGIARPWADLLLPAESTARYLAGGEAWFFLLCGSAFAAAADWRVREGRTGLLPWAALAGLSAGLFLFGHQFGAALLIAGAGLFTGLAWRNVPHALAARALPMTCAVLMLLIAGHEFTTRAHLPRREFDRQLSDYLAARGEAEAMLLVPYQQEAMQARTGHPVMADMATPTWIPYKPELGPGLWKMYRELYGIDVAPGLAPPLPPYAWHEVWPAKSAAEWQSLGRAYAFNYIVAPAFMSLPLEAALRTEDATLYRVAPVEHRP